MSVWNVMYLLIYYIYYICDTFFTRDLHVGVEHTVDISPVWEQLSDDSVLTVLL